MVIVPGEHGAAKIQCALMNVYKNHQSQCIVLLTSNCCYNTITITETIPADFSGLLPGKGTYEPHPGDLFIYTILQ